MDKAEANSVSFADPLWVLRGCDVSKRYGQTVAVDSVDLTLRAGESLAVMGPSGSGKSTLLHLLAGVIHSDSGQVMVKRAHGRGVDDLGKLDDGARSAFRLRRFGFVFQQGMLLPELTSVENVALPLMLIGHSRNDAVSAASDLLDRLDLAGLGNRRIGQLSGGQAQRVAVARALVCAPTVVFADEPTAALDSESAREVLSVLLSSAMAGMGSLVVVTHDVQIAEHCDRIVYLQDGRIENIA